MIQVLREVLIQKIPRQIRPKWKMNKVKNDIAYADEPLADEELLKMYEEEVDETNKLEQELTGKT